MSPIANKVFDEALSLPASTRISLIEKLVTSLNLPISPEIDHLWAGEAERRIAEIECGEVKLIPGEDVFEKIRRKYMP